MIPKRATMLAGLLLALFALADLIVAVAVAVAPHQRYRAVGLSLFVVLSVLTGVLAWRVWQRRRWAYWVALVAAGLFLPASVAAVGKKGGSAFVLALDLLLLAVLLAAYPAFRREAAPLYLTPSER